MGPGIAAAYMECVRSHGKAACDAIADAHCHEMLMALVFGMVCTVLVVAIAHLGRPRGRSAGD